MAKRYTKIKLSQIEDILPSTLDSINALVNEYIPSYDENTGKFRWVENTSTLSELTDVDFDSGTPADNNVLRYDSGSGKWKAEDLPDYMLKATYDSDEDGIVDKAEAVDDGLSGSPNLSTASEIRDAVQKRNDYEVVDGVKYPRTSAGINQAIDALGSNGGIIFLTAGEYLITEKVKYDYDNTIIRGASGLNTEYQLFSKYNTRLIACNRATFDNATSTMSAGYPLTGSINGYTAIVASIIYDTPTSGTIYYYSLSNTADFVEDEVLSTGFGHDVTLSSDGIQPNSALIDFNARSNTELSNICIIGGVTGDAQHALIGTSVGGGTRLIDRVGFFYYNYGQDNGASYHLMADHDTVIKNCYFYRCSNAIYLGGGFPGWTLDRNRFYNNRFVECTYGIRFHASYSKTNNIVRNNKFYNCTKVDISCEGQDKYMIIANNSCINDGSGEKGIVLANADNNIILGNYSIGHSVCGIDIDASSDGNEIIANNCQDVTPYINNGTNNKTFILDTITDGTNEASLSDIKDAIDKKHEHSNKSELDLVTDGDHDVRTDNPHNLGIEDLIDVEFDTGTPIDENVLQYDSLTGKWKARTVDTDKIIEGDSSVEVVDISAGAYIKSEINSEEQLRLLDGKLRPANDNDISLGDNTHRFKELHLMPESLYLGTTHVTEDLYNRHELNILLNAFRIAINGSLSYFNMTDGIVDEFEDQTGVDISSSLNEDYNETDDYYGVGEGEKTTLDEFEYATDEQAQLNYVDISGSGVQAYSEDTIVTQGSGTFALKVIADQTVSLNQKLEKILESGTPLDLSARDALSVKVRASRTGENFNINLISVPDNCVFLMRGNGVDGSQADMIDESSYGESLVFPEGAYPQIDDTSSPFGQTSIRTALKYCYVSHQSQYNFTTDDFCIEFWYKRGSENLYPSPLEFGGGYNGEGIIFKIESAKVAIGHKVQTEGWWDVSFSSGSSWHHLALERYNGTVTLYIDGTALDTQDWSSEQIDTDGDTLKIGYPGSSLAHEWDGWIDEIVIYNEAIYKTDFTPRTQTLGQNKYAINILSANTWETKEIEFGSEDVSNVSKIEIEITNADSLNTIYLDDFYAYTYPETMTLISNGFEAESEPDNARIVIFEEDISELTLNTDIKAYISKDDGITWAQATLSDEGDYGSNKRILTGNSNLAGSGIGSGTDMKWKVELLNSKSAKIHGIGALWS